MTELVKHSTSKLSTLILEAAKGLKSPGPWARYAGESIPVFLDSVAKWPAEMRVRGEIRATDAEGYSVADEYEVRRTYFVSPLVEALRAMPYLWRGVVRAAFERVMVREHLDGEDTKTRVFEALERAHQHWELLRSSYAAEMRIAYDGEFAIATIMVEEGVYESCTLEEAYREAVAYRHIALQREAGRRISLDLEGWGGVVKARLQQKVADAIAYGGDVEAAKDRLHKFSARAVSIDPLHKFWAVNRSLVELFALSVRMERQLPSIEWKIGGLVNASCRMFPGQSEYAGNEPGQYEFGRMVGEYPHAEHGCEESLGLLLQDFRLELEAIQSMVNQLIAVHDQYRTVWELSGYKAPVLLWLQEGHFTIDQIDEAKAWLQAAAERGQRSAVERSAAQVGVNRDRKFRAFLETIGEDMEI